MQRRAEDRARRWEGGPSSRAKGGRASQSLQALSSLEVLCGLLLCLWSLLAFQGALAWTGAALGLLCSAAGVLGALGSATGGLNTLNATVVAALLASALVAQHAGRAYHAGHVDCALAELSLLERSVRSAAERQAGSPHGQEALHAIKLRLDALDGTLTQLQLDPSLLALGGEVGSAATSPGAAKEEALHRAHQQQLWKASEARYVEGRIHLLKKQAQQVINGLVRSAGTEGAPLRALGDSLSPGDRAELDRAVGALFHAAEGVASRLELAEVQAAEGKGAALGPEEYEALVASLATSLQAISDFVKRAEEVLGSEVTPLTHARFERMVHGAGGAEAGGLKATRDEAQFVGDALRNLRDRPDYAWLPVPDVSAAREAWRSQWEGLMLRYMQYEASPLDDLPRRCVSGRRAERALRWVAAGMVALQAAAAYAALGAARRAAAKPAAEI